jgi:hypothetical protein
LCLENRATLACVWKALGFKTNNYHIITGQKRVKSIKPITAEAGQAQTNASLIQLGRGLRQTANCGKLRKALGLLQNARNVRNASLKITIFLSSELRNKHVASIGSYSQAIKI